MNHFFENLPRFLFDFPRINSAREINVSIRKIFMTITIVLYTANFKTSHYDQSLDRRSALGLISLVAKKRFENGSTDYFFEAAQLLTSSS